MNRHPRARAAKARFELSENDVISPRVSQTLDGLRIAHLSDIHVRTGVRPRRLIAAVEQLHQLKPDLVALTGDYVCFSPRPLPQLTAALKELPAPAFAVLGNHDHWSGASKVRAALEKAGVDVLCNEHRTVSFGERILEVIGLDDPVTRKHDPAKAFRDVQRGSTQLVLSHCPASADVIAPFGATLVLSGHTHGGQVHLPKVTPYLSARMGVKYLRGFFQVDGTVLFVNRGLGESLPLRIRARPEVACLTLRTGLEASARPSRLGPEGANRTAIGHAA